MSNQNGLSVREEGRSDFFVEAFMRFKKKKEASVA